MDNLRDQMEALAQGIVTSQRERKMAVGGSQAQTARMLQAFGRERTATAKDLKSGFVADRVSRSANVHTILANTGTMCDGFRQDHVRMQRSLRRRLVQSTEAVATFVASLRADFAKGRTDFTKAYRHMTKAQRAGLAKDRRDRSREVAELINDFHVSRGEMAQKLAESLAKSTQEIKAKVSGLNGFRLLLQKTSEGASVPGPIPNYLLTAQGSREAPAPFAAFAARQTSVKKKTGKNKDDGR
ncbi:MAG: hypothetical protein V2A66_02925 [Pseudomonadota bacterium]